MHARRFRHDGKSYIAFEGGVPAFTPGTLVATGNAITLVADGHVASADELAAGLDALEGARMPDNSGRRLLWSGLGCIAVVVLTHIAERMHSVPGMGWGQPDSAGHYLDLVSAIAGIALLLAAGVFRLLRSK